MTKLPIEQHKKPKNFRLSPDVIEKLDQLAKWEGNFVTRVVERLIRDEYARQAKRRGIDPDA